MADDQPHDDQPDPYLAEHAGEIADAIIVLQEALGRVDLLDDQDRRICHWHLDDETGVTVAIEFAHPDGGPWLCSFDGLGTDTIVATRPREDGEWEHSVLDEYGVPIEWRTAIRPDFN
jgi:hypothetical protein